MTIEWNDSEPTFPDFLPPLEPKPTVHLTAAQAKERIEGVLDAAGIAVDVWIESTWKMEFPDGAKCYEENFYIESTGYPKR